MSSCRHDSLVFSPPPPPPVDVPDTGCQDGDVRLTYQQQGGAVGNVEICFENQWQAACNQFFNQEALNVTCRFLGFDEYQNSPSGHMFNLGPIINASIPVFEEFLSCSGTESGLSECLFISRRKRQTACSPDQVVRITCQCKLMACSEHGTMLMWRHFQRVP